jgi:hypothetical protein
VDGVAVTDMSATGSSSTYYDFDAFQEMQMTTGGSDPSISVPGVTINMVTKRGTNEVHGSARVFDTPSQLQARPVNITGGRAGNSVNHIDDYGVEAGGPIWPDKAWLWGSYAKQQINKIAGGGAHDDTTLEDFAGKLNIQPIESNTFTLFHFRGDKIKVGRGAAPDRPGPTTWNQTGPTRIWKGEDSQVFGPNLVATASLNYVDGGFKLIPQGGNLDVYQDTNLNWQNSFQYYSTYRPQHQVQANLSSFFNTGSLGHELKFGFGYRKISGGSHSAWPGQGNVGYENYGGGGFGVAKLTRDKLVNIDGRYTDAFIGDTITANKLTMNIGLRYDYQYTFNNASNVAADPAFPDLLPAINYPGAGPTFKFKDWEPRAGLTYALGSDNKTLLRASYARYADQLGTGYSQFTNPIGYQYLYYYWTDANANHRPDPGELGAFYGSYGVNPACPTCIGSPNSVNKNIKNTKTDEFMIGADRQLLPEFVAGLTYTYRHRSDFIWSPYTQITSADYSAFTPADITRLQGRDANGNPIGAPVVVYGATLPGDFTHGKTLENRPGYTTNYHSVELQLTKRLANRWMAHGGLTWTDWKQKVGNKANGCQDPTNVIATNGDSCDNGIVYFGGASNSGSFGNTYINAKWAFNVNGLYQLPWNFNISANLYGRQGYPAPYYVSVNPGDGLGTRKVVIGNPDDHRNKDLYQLDLRLEKVLPLFQKADLTLSIDLFNSLNSHTALQTRINATPSVDPNTGLHTGASIVGNTYEVQNPRILRFGARLTF